MIFRLFHQYDRPINEDESIKNEIFNNYVKLYLIEII